MFSDERKKNYKLQLLLQSFFIKPTLLFFAGCLKCKHSEIKQCTEKRTNGKDIGGKILKEEMKRAKFWRQYIGAENITQGSEVRQTVRLNSSGRILEIRKKRLNLLGVICKGKGSRCLYRAVLQF